MRRSGRGDRGLPPNDPEIMTSERYLIVIFLAKGQEGVCDRPLSGPGPTRSDRIQSSTYPARRVLPATSTPTRTK